ncbi:MAG: DUF4198 domain-containing protein [Pricia sp.]
MNKKYIILSAILVFCSHDMYLKMDTYFLEPDQQVKIQLYNGTFEKSENVIDRNRMLEASLTGNGKSYEVTEDQWSEKDSVTILSFQTGDAGTWVAGVSTKPRTIEMKAEDFNNYLEHDGVVDMLEQRKENDVLQEDAVEEYSKHVKAIFQVGDETSDDWGTTLGYPIEFVPLSNPYETNTGDELQVKLLFEGQPLVNQLVYADYKATEHGHTHDGSEEHGHAHSADAETNSHSHDGNEEHGHTHEKADAENHSHSHTADEKHEHSHEKASVENQTHSHANDEQNGHSHSHDGSEKHEHENGHQNEAQENAAKNHQHTSGQQLRTDQNGILNLKLTADGIWYLRTIHLTTSEEAGLTHESNWATLTFEVTHDHEHGEGADGHTHAEEDGFPSYIFWIGSLIVLGGLFFWFSRKNKA